MHEIKKMPFTARTSADPRPADRMHGGKATLLTLTDVKTVWND